MRWLYVRWQRVWETMVPRAKASCQGRGPLVAFAWSAVLGLLASGSECGQQHRMLHTTPQQQISARPNSVPPVLPTPAPKAQRGRGIWAFGQNVCPGPGAGSQSPGHIPRLPSGASRACAQIVIVSQGAGHVIIGVDGQPVRSEEDLATDYGSNLRWHPGAIVPDQLPRARSLKSSL